MATIKREDVKDRSVKLTIEVPLSEMQPFLDEAAKKISEVATIPGFRPGHASYEAVKGNVGEMKIYEEALEGIVRKTYVEAIESEKLESVGAPEINVEKMAPGNALVYTATVGLMPTVEKLADFTTLKVEKKDVSMQPSDLEGALKELQKMQTKEVRAKADEAATKADKAVVDMHMFHQKVALEGGDAHGYHVFLNEPHYIPGFSEQLVGMKEGEEKKFALPFPKDHYQKHLAGKDVDFEVKLAELYHLDHPDLDDAFGVSLGFKNLAELKDRLQTNIQDEKLTEENMRLERAVLDAVADGSRFSEIPELLVNDEVNKMVHEIEHNVTEQGMDFNQYLKSINKTIGQLKMDFVPQAIQRIKVMLVLREVAKQQNVTVDPKDLDHEIDTVAARYEDKESKDRIYSPMYREYMEGVMRNKKVVDLLKAAMVK